MIRPENKAKNADRRFVYESCHNANLMEISAGGLQEVLGAPWHPCCPPGSLPQKTAEVSKTCSNRTTGLWYGLFTGGVLWVSESMRPVASPWFTTVCTPVEFLSYYMNSNPLLIADC